jgi:hypothetical protein
MLEGSFIPESPCAALAVYLWKRSNGSRAKLDRTGAVSLHLSTHPHVRYRAFF